MATTASSKLHVSSYDHLAHQYRLQECLRALRAPGWEQCLAPLAQHMAQKHLVRGRRAGAPLRHLDLDLLRLALSRLLSSQWDDGYLVFQLVVEGQDPAVVAAERAVSRPALVELLRDAIGELALEYEEAAFAALGQAAAGSPHAPAHVRAAQTPAAGRQRG
jgi:hypothetical protein